jgi:hypothetical protein
VLLCGHIVGEHGAFKMIGKRKMEQMCPECGVFKEIHAWADTWKRYGFPSPKKRGGGWNVPDEPLF